MEIKDNPGEEIEVVGSLISPPDSAKDQPISLTFHWKKSSQIKNYRFELSGQQNFSSIVQDSVVSDTVHNIAGLNYSSTYFWQVTPISPEFKVVRSATWQFVTIVEPPAVAQLLFPPPAATEVATTVDLTWKPSERAESYDLQVATDSLFSRLIADTTDLDSTFYKLDNLSHSTTYYWRVRAANPGGASSWSVAHFSTVPDAPEAPRLISPAAESTNQPVSVALSWEAVEGVESYQLELASEPGFSDPVHSITGIEGTTYQINNLAYESTYYWRVRAENSGGVSPWSTVWHFSTVPAAPDVPALAAPADEATNQPTSLTLTWQDVPQATAYQLQVATNSEFTAIVDEESLSSQTSFEVTNLERDRTYYWRIRSQNPGGTSAWSASWRFTTIPPVSSAPGLVAPLNGAENQPLMTPLVWHLSENADTYQLQVALDKNVTSIIIDQADLTDSTKTPAILTYNTAYYWRVRAKNPGGFSTWSPLWTFTTVPPTPGTPVLSAPVNGATDQPTDLTLIWQSIDQATYHLQLAYDPGFSNLVADQPVLQTSSYAVTNLERDRDYYWRVRAESSGGISDWSSTRTFTTIPPAPTTPNLTAPVDGASDQPTTCALSWQAAERAASYHLQVATDAGFADPIFDNAALTDLSATLSNLSRDQTYYWRVRAANTGGQSAWAGP
ncbi:MAG TPA: fibronectin type III domain-containing protein, partial [bacterium]|nr:fibronectin type III domain-containing protein [bacterium]